MLEIKSEKKDYGINFPTSLNEITPEILDNITKDVKLAPHQCIVVLAYKIKIFDLAASINSTSTKSTVIVPMVAKLSDTIQPEYIAKVGEKVSISRSSLEMGIHLPLPTMISLSNVKNYFEGDQDLIRSITRPDVKTLPKDKTAQSISKYVYILEFKIVPIGDIIATRPVENKDIIDPFRLTTELVN